MKVDINFLSDSKTSNIGDLFINDDTGYIYILLKTYDRAGNQCYRTIRLEDTVIGWCTGSDKFTAVKGLKKLMVGDQVILTQE